MQQVVFIWIFKMDWHPTRCIGGKAFQDITTPEPGNIDASGTTWGHLPEYAFDNNLNTKWLHFVSENAWISYFDPQGIVVHSYSITSADDVPERDPGHWLFQGSMDGTTWIVLDEQTNQDFNSRFERRLFHFQNEVAYHYYRFFVLENHGDGSIQLQELEFIGNDRQAQAEWIPTAEDKRFLTGLAPGAYRYEVFDANQTQVSEMVSVLYGNPPDDSSLEVVANGHCNVQIAEPDPAMQYYWHSDRGGSDLLQMGPVFTAEKSGNYFVRCSHKIDKTLSMNSKGFAVQVEDKPAIEILFDSLLAIVDPVPEARYEWYSTGDNCPEIIGEGPVFDPGGLAGYYYAAKVPNREYAEEIDPKTLDGLVLRMDASDLNGDGVEDHPAPPTSSILDWDFENGNHWARDNWFAYRSNFQNGLGIVDFATIWLQRIERPETDFQTILMAYRENPLSFPGTAPFEGLAYHMPKGGNDVGILGQETPVGTLNGGVFLNGEIIDPISTTNPFAFCVLGARLNDKSDREIFYTDMRWEGQLGELLLWDHRLSDDEMQGVSEFLWKKWIVKAELESPGQGIFFEGSGVNTTGSFESINALLIYPNPGHGVVRIESGIAVDQIRVYTIDGKLLLDHEWDSLQAFLDISTLPVGHYWVQSYLDGKRAGIGKLVVH